VGECKGRGLDECGSLLPESGRSLSAHVVNIKDLG
jgi:hypothetical protein